MKSANADREWNWTDFAVLNFVHGNGNQVENTPTTLSIRREIFVATGFTSIEANDDYIKILANGASGFTVSFHLGGYPAANGLSQIWGEF